jgi:hypothetical protein
MLVSIIDELLRFSFSEEIQDHNSAGTPLGQHITIVFQITFL